jgi:hypothetical protein
MSLNPFLYLATGPMDTGYGRRCGIWISPWVNRPLILDTRALHGDDIRHAGRDSFPDDCVLVVVNPKENHRLIRAAAELPYPVSGPLIASEIISAECRRDPDLARRIQWRIELSAPSGGGTPQP